MELVSHLWKFSEVLAKVKNPEANETRNHYIQCCRELGEDVDLPDKFFGPKNMCPHCGSLWNSINHTVRISKGQNSSASLKKLTRSLAKRNPKLSTIKQKLIDKLEKNKLNKLIITCSCCQKKTKIVLPKIKKEKPKRENLGIQNNGVTLKKKKRKSRDKTAGLLISPKTPKTPKCMDNPIKKFSTTPVASTTSKELKKSVLIPPTETKKKINFLKVKGIINSTSTPLSKKSVLDSFLTEN